MSNARGSCTLLDRNFIVFSYFPALASLTFGIPSECLILSFISYSPSSLHFFFTTVCLRYLLYLPSYLSVFHHSLIILLSFLISFFLALVFSIFLLLSIAHWIPIVDGSICKPKGEREAGRAIVRQKGREGGKKRRRKRREASSRIDSYYTYRSLSRF